MRMARFAFCEQARRATPISTFAVNDENIRARSASFGSGLRVSSLREAPRNDSRLKREAGSAAARRLGFWIIDLERSADQVIDEIDLGTCHVIHRDRIDQDHRAVAADDEVVCGPGAVHVEPVLKARAATAFNAHAQHGSARLTLEDVADPTCRPFADRDARVHCCSFRSYWQKAQWIVKCACWRGQCGAFCDKNANGCRDWARTGCFRFRSCAAQGEAQCGDVEPDP